MAGEIPTFVTHYHLADKPPFLNLSDLDEARGAGRPKIWRLLEEERFLARNLPGYTEYQKRVRYRLVPFVW
jgi:hypothetical protein